MESTNAGAAPVGYKEVPSKGCDGCAFEGNPFLCGSAPACCSCHSATGFSVIYVALETASPATLLHPMGSMGEPVEG